jgi:hypothetical protein
MRKQALHLTLLVAVAVAVAGCPTKYQKAAGSAMASIPTTATIGTLYTTTITAPTGMTVSAATPAWLAYDATTGVLSGTPDGNDFGTYTVTLTATSGSNSGSSSVDIVVAPPTLPPLATVTPVPWHATSDPVTVTIAPAPDVSYTGTLTKVLTRGSAGITPGGPGAGTFTSDDAGDVSITLSWSIGGDFDADVFLNLTSSSGETVQLGPVKFKSE